MTDQVLDLFCGAGGAGAGYARAGFKVTGVDVYPQPSYPFTFVHGDAIAFLEQNAHMIRETFAFIHASPPCQDHSALTKGNRRRPGWIDVHKDLIAPTRTMLDNIGVPYVIENVAGAPIRKDLMLCGEMFGLQVIRHRFFELGGWFPKGAIAHREHRGRVAGMRHGVWYDGPYFAVYGDGGGKGTVEQWKRAMGIDWTDERREIAEAIPPAYTEWIANQYAKSREYAQLVKR